METFKRNQYGEINKGGRIVCSICGNKSGVKWTKNRRGNDASKWTDRITCQCGTTEKINIKTGEILQQKINENARKQVIYETKTL